MANAYGFDGAKVTNTVSAYKTAELARDKVKRGFEKEDAEFEEYGNYITKHNKNSITEAVDENEDGEIDAHEEKNALLATGKKWGAIKDLRATDEKTANAKNIISNRNARTGISRGHLKIAQSRLAITRAKDKRLRIKQAKSDANDKILFDLTVKEGQKQGLDLDQSTLLALDGATKVKAKVKAISDMTDLNAETEIKYQNGKTEGIHKIATAETPEQQLDLIMKGKDASDEMLLKAIKSKDQKAIERASEMVELSKSFLNEDGTVNTSKVNSTYMQSYNTGQSMELALEKKMTRGKGSTRKPGKITENQKKGNIAKDQKVIRKLAEDDGEAGYPTAKEYNEAKLLAFKRNKQGLDSSPDESYAKAKEIVMLKYEKAKGGEAKPVKYQVSEDGKKIYNGKKWVKYNKKK